MNPAAFLDRDGVINAAVIHQGRPYPPATLEELHILPRVPEAVAALRSAGYRVIIVTNQPDVGKGTQSRAMVEAMHLHLQQLLPIDAIKVCYHVDRDNCECRKPRPGMLLDAAAEFSLELGRSFMIGDRWRDIEAGRAAGCRTVLIGTGYGEPQLRAPDAVASSLWDATTLIMSGALGLRPSGSP